MDSLEEIRKHVERAVTHIAREHQATDDVVWKQMFIASAERFKTKKIRYI